MSWLYWTPNHSAIYTWAEFLSLRKIICIWIYFWLLATECDLLSKTVLTSLEQFFYAEYYYGGKVHFISPRARALQDMSEVHILLRSIIASLCGSVGKDLVYHACGHEFEFSVFPRHLWLLLSEYRGVAKWFGAHYNQEVRFSSAVKCKKWPQVLTLLLFNQRRNYYYYVYTPGQPCLTVTSEWRKVIRWGPSAFINNRKG